MPDDRDEPRDIDTMRSILEEPFGRDRIKSFKGRGGKMYDYVPGEDIIRRLNDATDGRWDLRINAIDERQMGTSRLVMATVALTIPGLGTREHIGVQAVSDNAGEDLIKGAVTDALKKAATLFGVALHLYGDDPPRPPQRAPQQAEPPAQEAKPAQRGGERPASEAQLKDLWVAADRFKGDREPVVRGILAVRKMESTKELTGVQAAKLTEYLAVTPLPEVYKLAGLPVPAPGPVGEREAELIAFRERAESTDLVAWADLYPQADVDLDKWVVLAELCRSLSQLDATVKANQQRGLYKPPFIPAERKRREDLTGAK